MTRLILLLTVTLPAFGQTIKFSREPQTNVVGAADEFLVNALTPGTTNYVTGRVPGSNVLARATNAVRIAAGSNITITTNVATAGITYTIAGDAGTAITTVGNTNITNINLQGWQIATPHSVWDNTDNGPAHTLEFRSMGNSVTTDETTGDGYLWLVSNTPTKTMAGWDPFGRFYYSPTNYWSNRLAILNNTLNSVVEPTIFLGNNTNLQTTWTINRRGTWLRWSNDVSASFSAVTNYGLWPQYHHSTNGTASTLTDIYTVFGAIDYNTFGTSPLMTNGNIYCTPFFSGAGGNLDSLMVSVVTPVVAGTVIMGLATTISPTNMLPGNLLYQSGPIDASATGSKITNLVTAIHLNPGQIYYTVVAANTNIAVKSIQAAGMNQILGYSTNFAQQCSFLAMNATNWNGNVLPSTIPTTNYQFLINGYALGGRMNGF